jgi:hypothetical protein
MNSIVSSSVRDALRIRWEMKQDTLRGVKPVRHANTEEAFLATCVLAEEFEKSEEAQAIYEQFRAEAPRG